MKQPTEMELRVLQLIARGSTDADAAEQLNIAHVTARTHMNNLMRHMKVHTRAHAVAIALCEGWIEC